MKRRISLWFFPRGLIVNTCHPVTPLELSENEVTG